MTRRRAVKDPTTIAELLPDPNNARTHNEANIAMIQRSIEDVGLARSIVLDESNVVLAGNGTIAAAHRAGLDRVRIIEADGDEMIAVRRTNLTQDQKTRLALFDNRSAELAEWDPAVLEALRAGENLDGIFDDIEMARLLGEVPTVNINEEWAGMPGYDHERGTDLKMIVHFRNEDDIRQFVELIGQDIPLTTKIVWFPVREAVAQRDREYVVDDTEPT